MTMFPPPRRVALAVALLAVAVTGGLRSRLARADEKKPDDPAATKAADPKADLDRRIMAEIKDRSQIMKNLGHLSDVIGPRLTGSPGLERANKWAADKMREYGLSNVRLEPWEIPVGWERGTVNIRLVEPGEKPLLAASAGWSPGTKGKVTGGVVILNARTRADLDQYKGKLKNAIVLRGAPATVAPVTDTRYGAGQPRQRAPMPADSKDPGKKDESPAKKDEPLTPPGPRPSFAELRALQKEMGEFFKAEGVAAVLRDSAKPHGLLVTTGGWPEGDRGSPPEGPPTLYVAHEHYALLHRLVTEHKLAPKVEVEVTNKFHPGPLTVYNTVGEITGSEKPGEFVVLGAHLDSWDLASGTTDNGTGSTVILEAARALGALAKKGVRPKRTIRFALFSGEEQGLHGSKQYVKRHEAELPRTSAALVHDTGTGKVLGLGLQGREAVQRVLGPELESLKAVGFEGVSLARMGGTDHLSFEAKGVPGFACRQDMDEYRFTHHTQSDTFDKAKGPNLVQGAQVLAVAAVRIANLPDLLPRERPAEPKKDEKKD